MDLVKKSGMMVPNTKVSTKTHPRKAKVSTGGQMATDISENGAIIC